MNNMKLIFCQTILYKINVFENIISLQYFSEFDKINLFNNGTVVYCENPMIPRLVELHAAENLKSMMKEKNSMIERKKECGCFYLQ